MIRPAARCRARCERRFVIRNDFEQEIITKLSIESESTPKKCCSSPSY